MLCPKCCNYIPDDYEVCPDCGAIIDQVESEQIRSKEVQMMSALAVKENAGTKAPMLALIFVCLALGPLLSSFWNTLLDGDLSSYFLTDFMEISGYILIALGLCLYQHRKTSLVGIGFAVLALGMIVDISSNQLNIMRLYGIIKVLQLNGFLLCGLGYFLSNKVGVILNRIGGILLIGATVLFILIRIMQDSNFYWLYLMFFNLTPIFPGVAALLYNPRKIK